MSLEQEKESLSPAFSAVGETNLFPTTPEGLQTIKKLEEDGIISKRVAQRYFVEKSAPHLVK